jgi:Tfp pilus assembly protein PilF
LGLYPTFADGHFWYANVLIKLHRVVEAEEHYRKAVEIKPDFKKAHENYGQLLRVLGRIPESEEQRRLAA